MQSLSFSSMSCTNTSNDNNINNNAEIVSMDTGNNENENEANVMKEEDDEDLKSRISESDNESTSSISSTDENNLIMKNKFIFNNRRKYDRKVDYLVDELIRKKNKTFQTSLNCYDHAIRSSVGPHPLDDNRLSIVSWPKVSILNPNELLLQMNDNENIIHKFSSLCNENNKDDDNNNFASKTLQQLEQQSEVKKGLSHAGDTTHTEWIIEEVNPILNNAFGVSSNTNQSSSYESNNSYRNNSSNELYVIEPSSDDCDYELDDSCTIEDISSSIG
jgi:hypothetical protein